MLRSLFLRNKSSPVCVRTAKIQRAHELESLLCEQAAHINTGKACSKTARKNHTSKPCEQTTPRLYTTATICTMPKTSGIKCPTLSWDQLSDSLMGSNKTSPFLMRVVFLAMTRCTKKWTPFVSFGQSFILFSKPISRRTRVSSSILDSALGPPQPSSAQNGATFCIHFSRPLGFLAASSGE